MPALPVCSSRSSSRRTSCIARWREVGISAGIVRCLPGLAAIEAIQGDAQRAARLFAAAKRHAHTLGVAFAEADRLEHDRVIAELSGQLDDERFAAAGGAGQSKTLDQAIEEAVGSTDSYEPLVKRFLGLSVSY